MKMKDLCASERPRERLLSSGAANLSNAELLAVLIRGGGGEDGAVDLANRLLSMSDGRLANLFNMSVERMTSVPWIGECKAASISAAFELGKRFLSEQPSVVRRPLTSPRTVYEIMIPQMKGLPHEECWVIFLNDRHYLISKMMMTSGGGTSTVIDARQIVRSALERNAGGVIMVHNHPSGNARPSAADIKETETLHEALAACGLSLVDHVVVSDDTFFSFADDKLYSA